MVDFDFHQWRRPLEDRAGGVGDQEHQNNLSSDSQYLKIISYTRQLNVLQRVKAGLPTVRRSHLELSSPGVAVTRQSNQHATVCIQGHGQSDCRPAVLIPRHTGN